MNKYTTVSDFISDIPSEHKKIVELLRTYIFEANSSLEENIKWNAPNYVHDDQDRITFNVMNKDNKVKVLIHKGSKEKEDKKATPIMSDPTGLITWNSNIRGTLEFDSIDAVRKNHENLLKILKKWLTL